MIPNKTDVLLKHYGTLDVDQLEKFYFETDFNRPSPPLSEWAKLQVPYTASEHPPLPLIEEINVAMKEHSLMRGGFIDVCRIGEFVVKRDACEILLQEAENMLFLQKHSQVRTAKVYAIFKHPKPDSNKEDFYLVAEYLHGHTMTREIYMAWTPKERQIYRHRFNEQMQLLRAVEPPQPEYYGRIHRQGFFTLMPFLTLRNQCLWGPYNSYEQLSSHMYESALLSHTIRKFEGTDWHASSLPVLESFQDFFKHPKGTQPVLTHLDAHFGNVIAQPIMQNGEMVDMTVTLIDWEQMGWLPACFQPASLRSRTYVEDAEVLKELFKDSDKALGFPDEADFEWFQKFKEYCQLF